mgnify:FL=1
MKHICATLLLLCVNPIQELDRVFIDEVKECALKYNSTLQPQDRIPIKLLIAQAIHESDWGKSRFAVQGNNLFGIKALKGEDYIRARSGKKVKTYHTKCESVIDYIDLLSFGEPYKELKEILISQWIVDRVDVYVIIKYLGNYAEDVNYENKIKKILQQLERD